MYVLAADATFFQYFDGRTDQTLGAAQITRQRGQFCGARQHGIQVGQFVTTGDDLQTEQRLLNGQRPEFSKKGCLSIMAVQINEPNGLRQRSAAQNGQKRGNANAPGDPQALRS